MTWERSEKRAVFWTIHRPAIQQKYFSDIRAETCSDASSPAPFWQINLSLAALLSRSFLYLPVFLCYPETRAVPGTIAAFPAGNYCKPYLQHEIEKTMTESHFPYLRLRRTRSAGFIRDMVRENTLSAADFIWPLFVCEGSNQSDPIASMIN